MTDVPRYGRTRVTKIRAAYNELRAAVQAGDIERAQVARSAQDRRPIYGRGRCAD